MTPAPLMPLWSTLALGLLLGACSSAPPPSAQDAGSPPGLDATVTEDAGEATVVVYHPDDAPAALSIAVNHGPVRRVVPTIRYTQYREEPGYTLCSAKTGTGVNRAARSPQSRYGDATQGNCSAQLRVRDAP